MEASRLGGVTLELGGGQLKNSGARRSWRGQLKRRDHCQSTASEVKTRGVTTCYSAELSSFCAALLIFIIDDVISL